MALIIFKYCLPALLAYILFVGISGQLNPFRKPRELAERPSWLLGLWTAVAITLVLGIGLHMAYQMNLAEIEQLLVPSAWLLAGILAPGLIAYFLYHRAVRQELDAQARLQEAKAPSQPDLNSIEIVDFDETEDSASNINTEFDGSELFSDITDDDIELPVTSDTFADRISAQLSANSAEFAGSEKSIVIDRSVASDEIVTGIEHMTWSRSEINTASTQVLDEPEELVTGIEHMHWGDEERARQIAQHKPEIAEEECVTGIEHMLCPEHQTAPRVTEHLTAGGEPIMQAEVEAEVEDQSVLAVPHDTGMSKADEEVETRIALSNQIQTLERALEYETTLREETEKHLLITRKGLSALESEAHEFELKKADALIELEERLEVQIKRTAKSEAHSIRIEKQKAALESQLMELKTSVLDAKREIRQSTAARAKALSTASKSVAFAQQAIKDRAALEQQLKEAEQALKTRQQTIGSLISTLEKEKAKTQESVVSMAKQLVLQEKQLQARRSIENASHTMKGQMSTRLVKKIAKANNKSAA